MVYIRSRLVAAACGGNANIFIKSSQKFEYLKINMWVKIIELNQGQVVLWWFNMFRKKRVYVPRFDEMNYVICVEYLSAIILGGEELFTFSSITKISKLKSVWLFHNLSLLLQMRISSRLWNITTYT